MSDMLQEKQSNFVSTMTEFHFFYPGNACNDSLSIAEISYDVTRHTFFLLRDKKASG